jgi:hypothetical protein
MRKSVIKISLAIFVVVAGILLALLAVMMCDSGPEISLGFLDGRAMTARLEQETSKSAYRTTREVYSFKADFNDVCARADAELSATGAKTLLFRGYPGREVAMYSFRSTFSGESVRVSIVEEKKLRKYLTPKWSKPSSLFGYNYESSVGWVSVEIIQTRPRSWPPKYFLLRLKLMLRRAANLPPAPNRNTGIRNQQGL